MNDHAILIGMGGTGARLVEAALMLAAAGEGPRSLSVLLIDADGAHGNGERTALALSRFHRFRNVWAGGAHGVDYAAADAPLLGRVAVEPLLPMGQWQWTPPPELSSLSAVADGVPTALMDTLFHADASEALRQVQHGLNGQAHVGAALFGAIFAQPNHPVVRALIDAMARGEQVVVMGSAFGGTSVGGTMALYRALIADGRAKGAVSAQWLPPYFDFGEDRAALSIRTQMAARAAAATGLTLLPMTQAPLIPLADFGRGGRAQCNPSMPPELLAAAQVMAHVSGEAVTPYVPPRTVHRLHHLIRLSHWHLYETQVRMREKAGLFSGNWAMAQAGKVDAASIGEPVHILSDICRRILEWAGSIAATGHMVGDPLRLGWHIAPIAPNVQPITGAPRQVVQMADPASQTARALADTFDALVPQSAPWPHWALVQQSLRRREPVAASHRGLGRALVAAHRAVAGEGALAL